MVQLAAWLAAKLAQHVPGLNEMERKALLVCGIAAGIGAVYHAPAAGVVFVLELALGFIAPSAVAPVLIASATGNALIFWFVDPLHAALYATSELPILPTSLGAALVAGLVFGATGWALLYLLERSRTLFHALARRTCRAWRWVACWSAWWRRRCPKSGATATAWCSGCCTATCSGRRWP